MNKALIATATLALFTLAACQNQPEVVDSRAPDPMEKALANAAPVELPPAVAQSVTFRCRDNSLAFVDFFQGNRQVNFKTERDGTPTMLRSETEGGPFTANGITVTGTPTSITLAQPEKPELTCRA